MQEYKSLLEEVMTHGIDKPNRTGVDARSLFFCTFRHNMEDGFPLLTTKKMAWTPIVGELLGFLRGFTSAAQFRELGCKIWDANANENELWLDNPYRRGEDDLGRIYGAQWRDWQHYDFYPGMQDKFAATSTDQLSELINKINMNPNDRRMVVTAYNPGEINKMALPPCHMFFQCWCDNNGGLSMIMYQRSCDMFLGVPFNIASYALLLEILAVATGRTPRTLNIVFADAHIYHNHFDQVNELLTRQPLPLPKVKIDPDFHRLEHIEPDMIELIGYNSHEPIKAEMAV